MFPLGCFIVGEVEPMKDFERSTGRQAVQAVDKATGLPIWRVNIVDGDDAARETAHKVKILSAVQPVPPERRRGMPFRPVEFEGLTAKAWVNRDRCQAEKGKQHAAGPGGVELHGHGDAGAAGRRQGRRGANGKAAG